MIQMGIIGDYMPMIIEITKSVKVGAGKSKEEEKSSLVDDN
jgi:hypothetical protein